MGLYSTTIHVHKPRKCVITCVCALAELHFLLVAVHVHVHWLHFTEFSPRRQNHLQLPQDKDAHTWSSVLANTDTQAIARYLT